MLIRPLQTTMKTSAAGDGPAVCIQGIKNIVPPPIS